MSTKQYPTAEYLRQCFRYEDGKLFWLKRPREHFPDERAWRTWNTRYSEKEAGSLKKGASRWKITINNSPYSRHVIVWILHYGNRPKEVDHENRIGYDDRIDNLRPTTHILNLANVGLTKRNTSGFKGVSWHKGKQKWRARICHAGKVYWLGYFSDPVEAHSVFVARAKELCGDFACGG